MASSADPTAPEFVLRLVDGRGYLGLRDPIALPLGRVEQLELEVPNLRFPFEGSGDAGQFRNRRCTVRDAALRIDEDQVTRWLESRPLSRYGIEELAAHLHGDEIQLSGAITIANRRATFTCHARISSTASGLRVGIGDLRTYRALPAPAPLVGMALLYALGARPLAERGPELPPGFVLHGIDTMEVDALALALWRSLLPWGWRLPRTHELEVPRVEPNGRSLRVVFGARASTTPGLGAEVAAPPQIAAGDELLTTGELRGALAEYEAVGDHPVALDRRLATLALLPDQLDEAVALGERVLAADPERGTTLTLLATLLAERGELQRAIELFERASVLAERAGDPGAAIEAALRAAELLLEVTPEAATPLLERVVAGRPSHTRAAALLAERLAAERRGPELLRLEKRRLSQARGQREEAQARVRLGAVWLDFQDEAFRARDELERALRLFEGDAATFRLYARALERAGELPRALEAIEQGLTLAGADAGSRGDRVLAATLAERSGRMDLARRHVEELLENAPGDGVGLALLARLAAGSGRIDDAVQAYDRAASLSTDEAERARLYFELAQLCLREPSARDRARVYLDRAAEAQPTLEILRAAAALAEDERRSADLDGILARLGALGDRDARTRRVRLLLETGRILDAGTEAEALATLGDQASLELLVEVRLREGRSEPYLASLERLVEASRAPGPRVELGRLRATAGDLARARILLEEALAHSAVAEDPAIARAALDVLCDVLLRQGDDASLDIALGRLASLRSEPAARSFALAAQGAARVRLGRLDAALSSYRDAVAAHPSDPQARLGLAEAAYALRLWDEARAALEPVHDAAPRADRALRLGEIAERQSRAADAIRFYEAALGVGASAADAQRIYAALAALHHARSEWQAEARVLLRAAEDARTSDTDGVRATRLVQAADLLRKRVGLLDEALPLYDRALALDPINLPALDTLESIALEREDWQHAAQILSRKVAATARRPAEQKAILGRLAVLQAERLGREDAAREAYARALAIDPAFRPALVFLAKDARCRAAPVEEIAHLERLAALPVDPAEPDARLADMGRLGQLYLEAGRGDEAEAMARRVLSEAPRQPAALALLDEVYTRAGRHAELEALLAVRAQVEPDFDAGVELLTRRAALIENAGRVTDAIAAYEQVTALRPNHVTGWSRLADLLRRAEAWRPLATALGRIADWHASSSRREEAAGVYVEQAHVLHDHLAEPEAARGVLDRAREVWPGSRLVLGALLALARGRGDLDSEASLLDQLIDLDADPATRGLAVLERARAMAARGDVEGALQRLRGLSSAQAPEAALRFRVELEEKVGSVGGATEVLERMREQAERAGDQAQELFVLCRLLRLSHESHPARAEALARRIAELDPGDRDALRVLADAAKQRGDAAAQVAALERLLDSARRRFEGASAEAELLLELGLAAGRRGDRVAANAHLREAVDAVPDDPRARLTLGRHLVENGSDVEGVLHLSRAAELGGLGPDDHLLLAGVYERLGQSQRAAAAVFAAGEAAPAGRRALAAAMLGNDVEARAAALVAISEDPSDRDALRVLLRGLSLAALIAQLDELTPRIGAARAAELIEEHAAGAAPSDARLALERTLTLEPSASRWARLGALLDGSAAVDAYTQALALDASHAGAALGLAPLIASEEAAHVLSDTLAAHAGETLDRRLERARLALRLGEIERDRGAVRAAVAAFERAIDESSHHASGHDESGHDAHSDDEATTRASVLLRIQAARALATAARAEGNAVKAERALGAVIDAGQGTDADLRMLAELLVERGALPEAIAILEGLPAPGELYALALERSGQPRRLLEHLVQHAGTLPPAEARAILLRAASLASDSLDEPRRAVELLERAVPLGPSDAELYERLGLLLRDRLDDPEGAAGAFARAYSTDPTRTHLLLGLGDFHYDVGELAPAHDYYLSLLASGTAPPTALPQIHARLAHIARHGADAIEEEVHLRRVAELRPEAEHLQRLVEIYRVRGDKLRLEQTLLQLAEMVTAEERLPLLREVRELMGPAPLAELDERILALDRHDSGARERVLARLRSTADPAALLDRLERELESALQDNGAISAEIPFELGRVSQERGELTRAARSFRLAVEHGGGLPAAQSLVDVLRSLGRLVEAAPLVEGVLAGSLSDQERAAFELLLLHIYLEAVPERALPLIEAARSRGVELPLDSVAYRRLLRSESRLEVLLANLDSAASEAPPEERVALALEAAELLEGPLQRTREAARRYAALFDEHPARRELAARARALYLAVGEPIYALAILDKEVVHAAPEDLPQLKITRGEILLAAGADAEAEAEFLHALITTKRVGRAHAALADVYRKRDDLASALEHLIAAADAPDLEPARAAACAVDAADVLLIEGDTGTAERLYQLAVALDPADRRALDALIRLAAAQGAYERQAELLGRAAALTADRRERARLLHERARLFEAELGRDLDAYRAYREAVACDPGLREAVRSLRTLAEARGEWAVAAEQLYREVALSDDPHERARLHLRLAQTHEERLFDTSAALRNLEEVAELFDRTRMEGIDNPWASLVRLYTEAQRFGDAAAAAEQLAASLPEETPSAAHAEALLRAATLHARAGDDARATQLRVDAAQLERSTTASEDRLGELPVDEQRRVLEDRLRIESDGEGRLALLRRLLALPGGHDDLAELDARAQELLRRAPDDAAAFLARRRVLEARKDTAGLLALLRARSLVVGDPRERAERRYEAGRLAESQLYDVPSAVTDYEAALDADPEHMAALEALADLSFRARHLQRARVLYDRLGDRSTTLGADEVARRRGELAEEAGDHAGAREHYAAAAALNATNLGAQQALARVSMRLGDDRGAYTALRAVLGLLPHDALDRSAELRRHLGELAAKLGELADARVLLEEIMLEDPRRKDVLGALADVYERTGAWQEAAALHERRALLADRNEERAELLFRRGEALTRVRDTEGASDAYLKSADLNPRHAPTLRRLVRHYLAQLDLEALAEVIQELDELGAPLVEAALDAGLGLALRGDEARGTILAAMVQPGPASIVESLGVLPWPPHPQFEAALRTCLRAAGGATIGRERLVPALEALVGEGHASLAVRYALALLFEQQGAIPQARLHLEILSFLDPTEAVDGRLTALGPATLAEPAAEDVVSIAARGPLRDALCDLGPLTLGLAVAPLEVEPAAEAAARAAPVAALFGHTGVEVALLDRLTDPAWAEPTRPPRLLIQRRLADDPRLVRYAAARALHALHAGLGLIHGRSTDDIGSLFRAAAGLFLPDLRSDGPFVRAWQAELTALGLRPELLPEATRARLEVSLATLVVDRAAADHAAAYGVAERLTANRVAYVVTGDLCAGLVALAGYATDDVRERERLLREDPAISDLVAFAFSLAT